VSSLDRKSASCAGVHSEAAGTPVSADFAGQNPANANTSAPVRGNDGPAHASPDVQKILVLYLKTGSGHLTVAQILEKKITECYGDRVQVILREGFAGNQFLARLFFESGYHAALTVLRGSYSVFYEFNCIPFFLKITNTLIKLRTQSYLERCIRQYGITKIVCLHCALVDVSVSVIRKNRKLPLAIVVTDPFTAHPSWFAANDAHYAVFSDELKNTVLQKFDIPDIRVFPYALKDEFSARQSRNRCVSDKAASGDSRQNGAFRVLIAGGGEGLPGIIPLVKFIVKKQKDALKRPPADGTAEAQLTLTVVCGKNELAHRVLSAFARKNGVPLTIYGYADNMPELISNSGCVVTKAGASLVMETLAMCKPLIISTYIHGQETGNMRYVTKNGAGWFIQKPKDIYKKLLTLARDPDYAGKTADNAQKLNIRPDVQPLAEYIFSL
jgi:processive 1,2-diacylglycerol beta-glucosyltransferase/1,2-diacylglycerol 3-beta-galactosyltransferase